MHIRTSLLGLRGFQNSSGSQAGVGNAMPSSSGSFTAHSDSKDVENGVADVPTKQVAEVREVQSNPEYVRYLELHEEFKGAGYKKLLRKCRSLIYVQPLHQLTIPQLTQGFFLHSASYI